MSVSRIPLVDLGAQHRGDRRRRSAAGFAACSSDARSSSAPRWRSSRRPSPRSSARRTASASPTAPTRWSSRCAPPASDRRRRGDPARQHLHRHRAGRACAPGARPVLVDCDPEHHLHRPRAGGRAGRPRGRAASCRCTSTARWRPIERARGAGARAWADASSRTPRRRRARARHGRARGRPSARRPAPASTRGRTWAPTATPARSLTDDDALAARVRALRNYGSEVKYHHPELGFNSRLDTLQAVVLSAKLKRLAAGTRRAGAAAAPLRRAARPSSPGVSRCRRRCAGNEHVFHLYVVRVPHRDEVLERLEADGIGAASTTRCPSTCRGPSRTSGSAAATSRSPRRGAEILSLPMYPEITPEQQARVVAVLRRWRIGCTRLAVARDSGRLRARRSGPARESDDVGPRTRVWALRPRHGGSARGRGLQRRRPRLHRERARASATA